MCTVLTRRAAEGNTRKDVQIRFHSGLVINSEISSLGVLGNLVPAGFLIPGQAFHSASLPGKAHCPLELRTPEQEVPPPSSYQDSPGRKSFVKPQQVGQQEHQGDEEGGE